MSTNLLTRSDSMLEFEASDVTGSHHVEVTDVEASLPAGAVAKALASRMALPENVSWSLRDDLSSELLHDSKSLGDQLGARKDIRLTVTPKAHLG